MPNDPNEILNQDAEFEAFYREILREFGPESAAQPRKKPASPKRAPAGKGKTAKKEKGLRALAVTLCLECVGIAAIAAWWVVRIL